MPMVANLYITIPPNSVSMSESSLARRAAVSGFASTQPSTDRALRSRPHSPPAKLVSEKFVDEAGDQTVIWFKSCTHLKFSVTHFNALCNGLFHQHRSLNSKQTGDVTRPKWLLWTRNQAVPRTRCWHCIQTNREVLLAWAYDRQRKRQRVCECFYRVKRPITEEELRRPFVRSF